MAKLAIGLSYVYFGKDAIVGSAAEELYKALWFKPNDEKPKIKGAGAYNQNDTFFKARMWRGFWYNNFVNSH